jgi:hypothetical protein
MDRGHRDRVAAVTRALVLVALAACGDLQGFGGPVPPLATFTVDVTGDVGAVRPPGDTGTPDLHVALVWGRQWLVEPMCILPPENDAAAAVIAAGCRDAFGFVPARVAANAPVTIDTPATLDLFTLPGADVMVGDLTARVAYASVVVYDDKDGDGTLDLARPNRPGGMMGPPDMNQPPTDSPDLVYGASFVTMTAADRRVAYREGAFIQSGFYPRAGCGDPPVGFAVLSAGGFTAADAIAATLAGTLPAEDPASCAEQAESDTTISIPVQPPAGVNELRCTERSNDSSVRYREPEADPPMDLDQRTTACIHTPSFGTPSDTIELVITGRTTDACIGLTHYILKGCTEGPQCGVPDWDHSMAPPSWWPC